MTPQEQSEATKKLTGLQHELDELRRCPQYERYIEQRKLASLDSKFAIIDLFLMLGILK